MDTLVKEALHIKNVMSNSDNGENKANYVRRSQSQIVSNRRIVNNSVANGQNAKISRTLISRKKFFPVDVIKEIRISPAGDKVAYIARNNGLDSIHIIPTIGHSAFANVINDNVHVKKMHFVGNNDLVYSYLDEENVMKLTRVNLTSKKRKDISPTDDAKSIRVIEGKEGIITVSYNGESYSSHKINLSNSTPTLIKESDVPLMAFFDDQLNPKLYYKNISANEAEVFVNDGSKEGRQIDQIDLEKEKYISISDSSCHKLSGKNGQTLFTSLNLKNNAQRQVIIAGVSKMSDCKAQLDRNKNPLFITVSMARKTHVPLCELAATHIKNLNYLFSGMDWRRVDSTADGNIWLICVGNPQKPDKYYLYDVRNRKLIATASNSLDGASLQPTVVVKIPTQDGSYLHGYLTKTANHSIKSPLILIVNARRRYGWEFSPLVQLLANRGYSVLCVNHRSDKSDPQNAEFSLTAQDIVDSLNWCMKNRVASGGNISIVAHNTSGADAIQAFLKNQKTLASCLLLSPTFPEENSILSKQETIDGLRKPLLVVNSLNNAGDTSSLEGADGSPLSYIGYEKKPGNDIIAGLAEKFFAKVYKNPRCEKLSAKDVETFTPITDGLALINQDNQDEDDDRSEEGGSAYDML
jgi:hypothetical protein